MTIDDRARAESARVRDELAIAPIPDPFTVVAARRRQRTTRVVTASALSLLLVAGAAFAVVQMRDESDDDVLDVSAPYGIGNGSLEVRPVIQVAPNDGECPAGTHPSWDTDLDGHGDMCFELGPSLADSSLVRDGRVGFDRGMAEWDVELDVAPAFIDAINQHVGSMVAFVVDGAVVFAPTINPGITGPQVQVAGGFERNGATDVAAGILGIPREDVVIEENSSDVVPDS